MVIARAESSERDAEKKYGIRPALARIEKANAVCRGISQQGPESQGPDYQEENIGEDVCAVWHVENRTLVGEMVIGLTLRNSREAEEGDHYGGDRCEE
jgi:hypothetical protein